MRFILAVILIAVLSAAAEWFLPWWMIAVVAFCVSLFISMKPGKAFLAGFVGIGVFWLIAAVVQDIPNDHILSARMAGVLHLPGYGMFIGVTAFVGGLLGGLAALAAALLSARTKAHTKTP